MNISVYPYTLSSKMGVKDNNNQHKFIAQPKQTGLSQDVFMKSLKSPSFTAKPDDDGSKDDIIAGLTAIGIVGAPFLLTIAAGEYYAKHADPNVIFMPDGTPIMRTGELKVETETIKADGDSGSLSIKGTGINIDPDQYDEADPVNGVYRNYDGSVDIDLPNHKYIDYKNNIIIDPENKISVISDGENLTPIVIPDVEGGLNFKGSSMPPSDPVRIAPTRSDYIKHNHVKPEDDTMQPIDTYGHIAYPDDNRNVGQKILDFFNPTKHRVRYFDESKHYDIFGREILEFKDSNGNIKQVALDEKLSSLAHKYNINDKNLGEVAEFIDKAKANETILHLNPDYYKQLNHLETFDEYKNRLLESEHEPATGEGHNTDVVHHPVTDDSSIDVPEHDTNAHEQALEHFFDTLREMLANADI